MIDYLESIINKYIKENRQLPFFFYKLKIKKIYSYPKYYRIYVYYKLYTSYQKKHFLRIKSIKILFSEIDNAEELIYKRLNAIYLTI